ncbi:MAG TPA: NAD(P)/FAD-dependent oxidoreductase [Ktedonobacterales bacterium]|nr:NAD(P)/FAD-dependent oxidoreductase [Ktedonobacterales bacterium]
MSYLLTKENHTEMPDGSPVYDVAIVGAGPAGSASAISFARAGRRVVLVDCMTFPRDKPCAEYLSPAAEPILRDLGVLDAIEATHPARLRGFRIYAPDGSFFQGAFANTLDGQGTPLFETGLAVPRLRLDAMLLNAARAAGAEVREGWRLANLRRDEYDGVWTLAPVGDQAPVRAKLLIAADGSHSTVARRLGLHAPGILRKIALVAHMRGIADLSEYGEMHVAGRRYVGIAPLEPGEVGDLCNVAMVVDERRDARKLAGRPQEFLLEALATFPGLRRRLAQVAVARRTLAVSRLNVRAKRLSDAGLLLVGDAAGYFDPFTGEGIYRGLRSAQLAFTVGQTALEQGDLSATTLAHYDRLSRHEFRGKRAIEAIIQSAVQVPPVMNHIASVLRHHTWMADTVVAVTGDFQPTSRVLRLGYLLRLTL